MRSSKSRSRSKSNRNRPSGNIVNRVFDSNGPEGKVRGTPQQVIDKYNQLARDAQLSGDRVALENFQQHAEHYVRMLNEAQREQREAQERRERQEQERREQRGDDDPHQGDEDQQGGDDQRSSGGRRQSDVIEADGGNDGDSTLVETPEMKPQRNRRSRKPRNEGDQPQTAAQSEPNETSGNQEAAE